METLVASVLLPGALAVVMFGLGLGLRAQDFQRVARAPRAVVIALVLQSLVLPVLCFVLLQLFGLAGEMAVGMMVLAASPGGTMANLFSHLSGGDVALNVTLTAINCVASVLTLPLVVNLSIAHFLGDEERIGIHVTEMVRVIGTVLVPVLIGMAVRRRWSARAVRMAGPLKRASAVILAVVILLALVSNLSLLREHIITVGSLALLLCCLSMLLGYGVPRALGIAPAQAVAMTFEVGLHNATVAVVVALSVLDDDRMSVAPAVYGVVMYVPAFAAHLLLRRRADAAVAGRAASAPLSAL